MKLPVSPLESLATDPQRFGFDAAVRVLQQAAHEADPGAVVRFRSVPGLAYPGADVVGLQVGEGSAPRLAVTVMGLAGSTGVLPRHYTEALGTSLRARSPALHDFLDLLSHRLVAQFAEAGIKYRPHRMAERQALAGGGPDGATLALLSVAGFGTAGLAERLETGTAPVAHYAGLFAAHPRSAERLRALASDWLGRPVEVVEFAGAWLPIPEDGRTRLAGRGMEGQFDRLGRDAVAGVRAWSVQAGIVLRVGPLERDGFAQMLPDGAVFRRLVSLVGAFLGLEVAFSVNPVLAGADVPPARLAGEGAWRPRLGWNTWLVPPEGGRGQDGGEAVFAGATG